MKKKNILYIHHVSTFGGASFCLLAIIKRINRNLYNPIVLLKTEGPLSNELKKLNIPVFFEKSITTVPYNTSLFRFSTLVQFCFFQLSKKRISKFIRKFEIDIVHLNTMMLHPYCSVAKKLNKKVVVHMREHWPQFEHHKQFLYAKKNIQKYSDVIVAINNTSANILDLKYKTEVIYDWIDFENRSECVDFKELFGKNYLNLKIFLFIGGLQRIKGALEITQVFSELNSESNIRLLFVGSNGKEFDDYRTFKGLVKLILRYLKMPVYSDKIKFIAQKDERIVFIPSTNQIKDLILKSYCSLSYPKIPHAILPIAESGFLGMPFISANTPEAYEYSDNGNSAVLYEFNNLEDFKNAFIFSLANEKLIKDKAFNSRKSIRYLFDPERNSEKLNNIYSTL